MKIKNKKIFYIIIPIFLLLAIFLIIKIQQKTVNIPNNPTENKELVNINSIDDLPKNKDLININTIRPEIENYLLSQKDFSWQTTENSHNFCSFAPLNKVDEIPLYIWVRCSEFKLENNELIEKSGISVPVKLTKDENNNYSYWIPQDGANYQNNLETEFSSEALDNIKKFKEFYVVNANYELIQKIKDYYQKDDLESPSSLIQNCEQKKDCILPFDYAIRSSCPYTTRCVNNKCEIYCPWEE